MWKQVFENLQKEITERYVSGKFGQAGNRFE